VDAITAAATEHGLSVLNSALKNTATRYQLIGAVNYDELINNTAVFYNEEIETSYYDNNGVLTFVVELPIAEDFGKYLYAIQIVDNDGQVVINAPTPKVALATGIGGMVTIKAAVTGEAGEVVFKASDYVTTSELQDLWLTQATNAERGLIRIATQAEASAGTATDIAVNPSQLIDLRNQTGLKNDNGVIKELGGAILGHLVQYKIYNDKTTGIQEVVEAATPFYTSLQTSFTPKYSDSLIVVRASGSFRVIRSSLGICGMDIQLYDENILLNGKFGFVYNSYARNIHHHPNMLHVDNRGGKDMRNYKIALLKHTTGNSLSYYPRFGQGSITIEEYQGV